MKKKAPLWFGILVIGLMFMIAGGATLISSNAKGSLSHSLLASFPCFLVSFFLLSFSMLGYRNK